MNKIALFGGTFDPIHLGHTACIQHLVENMDFTEVVLLPTSQNPLKQDEKPASREHRMKMIELAMADFREEISIDETEIEKSTPSYTVDTLKRYREKYQAEELYLVMGLDSFTEFDRWHQFEEIMKMANLVIVSRPPYRRPYAIEDLPKGVQPQVHSYEKGFALLESGRTMEFVAINTEDISSSMVRKKLKSGKSIQTMINLDVEKYMAETDVYPRLDPGAIDFKELALFSGGILKERATNSAAYDLTNLDKLYDYTIIASATSTKQAQALANNIKERVREEYGLSPFAVEGREDGRWVILDYGALIVHIFYDYVRQEYHLEQLWKDGTRLEL